MTLLKLDLNERSETPPNWAIKALTSLPMDTLWRYQDRSELEKAYAEHCNLNADQVLFTNGGDEGIQYLFSSLANSATVILPLPIFGFYREQAALWKLSVCFIAPKPDLSVDFEEIQKAIERNPGALCVLTRPNNPTGEVIHRKSFRQLLQLSKNQQGMMLLDEAYVEFFNDSLLDLLQEFPNLIILRTFSKAMGLAGLRLGVLLGTGPMIPVLRGRVLPYNIAAPSLRIGLHALGGQALEEIRVYAGMVAKNRDRILEQLLDWSIETTPSKANFILLRLTESRAAFVKKGLLQMGMPIRSFSQPELNGCLRISIPADSLVLEQGLALLLRPQLICLDVDGTLLDTRQSFDELVMQLVETYTGQKTCADQILAIRAKGGFNDDFALVAEICRMQGVEVAYSKVASDGSALYFGNETQAGLFQLEQPIYRQDFLERLHKNYTLALVTGRSRAELATADPLLDTLEPVIQITIDDVRQGKPHPEGIKLASQRANLKRIWMIGDNPDDIHAAHAAGAIGIGVGPNRLALEKAGATAVLETINELEALL